MRLPGTENLTHEEAEECLSEGGRFVFYEVCISIIVVTLRRPTCVHRLRPGEQGAWRGLPYTLITVLLGWWGIPWGFIYTPLALLTNLLGGRDITAQVLAQFDGAPFPNSAGPSPCAPR